MLTLETPRLLLRDSREGDISQIVDFFAEPESVRSILRSQRNSASNRRVMGIIIEHSAVLKRNGLVHLSVELKSTRELIGKVNLEFAAPGKAASIGWHFGAKFSGHGYATEAAAELMKYGWEEKRVSMICGDCFEDNAACQRIFQKLGMCRAPFIGVRKHFYSLKYREWRPIVRWQKASK